MSVSANSENVEKVAYGAGRERWRAALGGHGVQQVLRLASNLVIARLVAPEAFGLMAVAASIYIWAVMLTDIGIASNVIRSPNSAKPDFLRTIWTFWVLRGLAIWVITIIAALIVMALASGDRIPGEDSIFTPIRCPALGDDIGNGRADCYAGCVLARHESRQWPSASLVLRRARYRSRNRGRRCSTMIVTISFAAQRAMASGRW